MPDVSRCAFGHLPEFSMPGFVPSEVVSSSGVIPYNDNALSVCDFIRAACDHGWVISYDWPEARAWAESLSSDPALLSATDLGDLRRLITLHVRLERFCDGHIAAMIRSGHLGRVLRRLTALRDPLPDTR